MSRTAVDVPPMNARRSTSSVRAPRRPAVIAADEPADAGPDDDDVVAVVHRRGAGARDRVQPRRVGDEDPVDGLVAEPARGAAARTWSSGSAARAAVVRPQVVARRRGRGPSTMPVEVAGGDDRARSGRARRCRGGTWSGRSCRTRASRRARRSRRGAPSPGCGRGGRGRSGPSSAPAGLEEVDDRRAPAVPISVWTRIAAPVAAEAPAMASRRRRSRARDVVVRGAALDRAGPRRVEGQRRVVPVGRVHADASGR